MQTPHTFTNSHTCTCTHMATLSHTHIHTPISHSQPHWYPTHPHTHTHSSHTHPEGGETKGLWEGEAWHDHTSMHSGWSSYPQYGIRTTPTLSMEYKPLLPSVWNMDHSCPHYGIRTTPTLSMEYEPLLTSVWNIHSKPRHGIWTTPNPSKQYRSLLTASIEYGPVLTPVWNMHCSWSQHRQLTTPVKGADLGLRRVSPTDFQ